MKNSTLLFIAIAAVFSLSCFAQSSNRSSDYGKLVNTQLMSDLMANNDLAVVSYHVEERINMMFGGSVTTYEVSNVSLVNTNDLGENNSRVITPKYGKAKLKATVLVSAEPAKIDPPIIPAPALKPVKLMPKPPKPVVDFVNIDILSTYERVLDKGYKSVDMLKRVANNRYFEGDMALAVKWYNKLFEITTDFEPVFYFRYAQALKATGQTEKGNAMMLEYEAKNK